SSDIEAREAGFLAFGENFWANRYSTSNSIAAITRDDLESFHRARFALQNFVVAVSGDFDRADMVSKLENIFSAGHANEILTRNPIAAIRANPSFAAPAVYSVNKPDVNQGRASMLH